MAKTTAHKAVVAGVTPPAMVLIWWVMSLAGLVDFPFQDAELVTALGTLVLSAVTAALTYLVPNKEIPEAGSDDEHA